jgi:hypothetical protein
VTHEHAAHLAAVPAASPVPRTTVARYRGRMATEDPTQNAARSALREALAPLFERLVGYEAAAPIDRDDRNAAYLAARRVLGAPEVGSIAEELAVAAVDKVVAEYRERGIDLDADALLRACGATESTVRVIDRGERAQKRAARRSTRPA